MYKPEIFLWNLNAKNDEKNITNATLYKLRDFVKQETYIYIWNTLFALAIFIK